MTRIRTVYPINSDRDARIALIGEAPGQCEAERGVPFCGASGKELTAMLSEANIVREECMLSNAFLDRPSGNNIYSWCYKKKEANNDWKALGNKGEYPFKPLKAGSYMALNRLSDVTRLHRELVSYDPHIIIALGNTPLWALTGEAGITKVRGTLLEADLGGNRLYKVIPTFHPAYILRNWDERLVVVADLMKAKRESRRPDYDRPKRELWLEPTLEDIKEFAQSFLQNAEHFSVDIETAQGQITCIGVGTRTHAICIPLWDQRKPGWSYWQSSEEEAEALRRVTEILAMPAAKIFQNGMYDMQWKWRMLGITPKGRIDDTMLMHHSMFPEMKKSLGFLGSIYTNETAWKRLRPKKITAQKKDDE